MRLILASGSIARRQMLAGAGLGFSVIPADLDETAIIQAAREEKKSALECAKTLADEKALSVSKTNSQALVIGSDQIMQCEGVWLEKAVNKEEAQQKLKFLRGKTHEAISAVSVAKEEKILWRHIEITKLRMHNFDDAFLERYIESAGDILMQCVGAYAIEKHGAQLFDAIEGDYFTVLGMPLLPLLKYLREEQDIHL